MLYAVFLWRHGFRRHDRASYALLGGAWCFHTLAMLKRGFALDRCPVTNLFEATMFVGWAMVAAYLAIGWWSRLRFLGAFASPVLLALGVFALYPGLDTPGLDGAFSRGILSLHASLVLLSYGAFGMSCVAALMYLTQAHTLKFDKPRVLASRLPPIERLEQVMSRALLAGVILLTAGLAITPVLIRERAAAAPGAGLPLADAKVIWSALVWLAYVVLLVMRWRFARGGQRLAWGVAGTFVFVLLTFWGTHLLSPLHGP
ncbi:MAG: cytochrome c biogenesis protein CcsA [Verrucomicrobia bacterium]|nr:cytochrome c biogenesis protein CcsA [Verrucomicrobiota bacterium]